MKGMDLITCNAWKYRAGTLVLFLLLLFPLSALAQTTVSTIEGTIRDAQGSMVSGAQVVVKSPALGIERTATSDANGFYRINALPAGNYSLTISHSGFTTRTFEDVELTHKRHIGSIGADDEREGNVRQLAFEWNVYGHHTRRPQLASLR